MVGVDGWSGGGCYIIWITKTSKDCDYKFHILPEVVSSEDCLLNLSWQLSNGGIITCGLIRVRLAVYCNVTNTQLLLSLPCAQKCC